MANFPAYFEQQYRSHLKHLKLEGLQPGTIDACPTSSAAQADQSSR